jgi:hypothetical protein
MYLVAFQFVAATAMLVVAAGAQAQQPSLGLLYNTQERSSLTYRCNLLRGGELECEFVQSAIRTKSEPSGLTAVLENARKQFKSEKTPTSEECGTYKQMQAVFEGKAQAPMPEGLTALTAVEKADGLKVARLMTEYCERPSEEAFLAVVRASHEREVRTCKVSAHTFKQSFRKVLSGASRLPTWVAQSQPEGVCGTVQLSRFEAEETPVGTSKFTNWKYVARKAISNPNAELFPGHKCSSLDEKPYAYDWRSKEHQLSCQYITFSPL